MNKNRNQVKLDRVEVSSSDVVSKETVGKSVNCKNSKFLCFYWFMKNIICSELYNSYRNVSGQTLIYRVYIRTMGDKIYHKIKLMG